MSTIIRTAKKRYLGMTIVQILILATILICIFLLFSALAVYVLFGNNTGGVPVSLPIISTKAQIVGKWKLLPKLLPTATPGPSPTPIVMKDFLGTPRVMPTSNAQPIVMDLCGMAYSDTLEFFNDGTYAGHANSLWNGGQYEILSDGRIKLSTLKNGISVYDYSISEDILTIEARDFYICEMRYQAVKQ